MTILKGKNLRSKIVKKELQKKSLSVINQNEVKISGKVLIPVIKQFMAAPIVPFMSGDEVVLGHEKEITVPEQTSSYVIHPLEALKKNQEELEEIRKISMHQLQEELNAHRMTQHQLLEEEKEETLKKAYESGYQQGLEKANLEQAEKTREFLSAINEMAIEKRKIFENAEPELMRLSISIAEKVIQTQIEKQPSVFRHILEEALQKITDKDHVLIKVNPKDLTFVKSYKDVYQKELSDFKRLDIQEDSAINKGGCIIETKLGFIDSSINTKIELITQALEKTLEDEQVKSGLASKKKKQKEKADLLPLMEDLEVLNKKKPGENNNTDSTRTQYTSMSEPIEPTDSFSVPTQIDPKPLIDENLVDDPDNDLLNETSLFDEFENENFSF